MIVEESNRLNQRLKPRNYKAMLKTGIYVYICEPSAMDDLITDCITSGVKLTRLQHGLLYGTREIANQLNKRLKKWVKWEKGLYTFASIRWLQQQYRYRPDLFAHWKLVRP